MKPTNASTWERRRPVGWFRSFAGETPALPGVRWQALTLSGLSKELEPYVGCHTVNGMKEKKFWASLGLIGLNLPAALGCMAAFGKPHRGDAEARRRREVGGRKQGADCIEAVVHFGFLLPFYI
jgi:hypothetical protein